MIYKRLSFYKILMERHVRDVAHCVHGIEINSCIYLTKIMCQE